jgi:2'-5' RNA ligase
LPRLFTGLELPSEIAAELSMLRGGISGARWIPPENYHITLRFIGDIDEGFAHEIGMSLGMVRRPSFSVTLEGLDVFGGDKPRAIVVRARSEPALMELQADMERLLRRLGAPPEPRKFTPHVTLARLRGATSSGVAAYLGARGYFPSLRFEAARFVLYSSRDSVGGGPYLVEGDYPLLTAPALRNAVG